MRALALAALILIWPAVSPGYVLEVIEGTDIPRRWAEREAAFVLGSAPPPAPIDREGFRAAAEAAFAAWRDLECNGQPTPFVFTVGDGDEGNVISWVHDAEAWTHGDFSIANTTVTVDLETGEILDVDIELNAVHHQWVLDDPDEATYDLQNALTHEVGHALGLDHTDVAEATMSEHVRRGETDDRTLHADDIAGYCALHGPQAVPWPMTAAPPGAANEGCQAGDGSAPGALVMTLVALALLGWRRQIG